MSETPAHLTLSPAQAVTARLRDQLRLLGADRSLTERVVPRSDIEGRPYVYLPALPLDVVGRLLAALATPDTAGAGS